VDENRRLFAGDELVRVHQLAQAGHKPDDAVGDLGAPIGDVEGDLAGLRVVGDAHADVEAGRASRHDQAHPRGEVADEFIALQGPQGVVAQVVLGRTRRRPCRRWPDGSTRGSRWKAALGAAGRKGGARGAAWVDVPWVDVSRVDDLDDLRAKFGPRPV